MRIAVIEAGAPLPALVPEHGSFGAMIRRMLGAAHAYDTYRACDGHLPGPDHDAYVISGSACGVHDGLAWIDELTALVRAAAAARRKMVGICFGHQLMAQAFGGTVARAPGGWGVGLHRYGVTVPAPWMDEMAAFACIAMHQDQVVAAPPRSITHAASAFTPHAVLSYDDHPSISVQFHPEFTPSFARALLERPRVPAVTDAPRAIASLAEPNDGGRVARWIGAFLAGDQSAGRIVETRKPARSLVT